MSPRIVPIANQAGGVGKTTTAVSLAALLAQHGSRVVLIDLDAQATATSWMGLDPETVPRSVGDVLTRDCTLADALYDTDFGVQVLPAATDLDGTAMTLQGVHLRELRLQQALADLDEEVDTVLIDCPGALSLLTVSALVVATAVLVTTTPGSKELAGILRLEDTVADVAAGFGRDIPIGGIVPCIVPHQNAGRLYADAMTALTDARGDLVTPAVRKSVRVPEALSHAVPVPLYAPQEPITEDYRAVLDHLRRAGVLR